MVLRKTTIVFFLWFALVTRTSADFFGRAFQGLNGEVFRIAPEELSAAEAYSSYSCDTGCGENCLSITTGSLANDCVTFCGCARFIIVTSGENSGRVTGEEATVIDSCSQSCLSFCKDGKEDCVSECKSTFCEGEKDDLVLQLILNGLVLIGILLGLCMCFKKLRSKRRRRQRLAQQGEGTYRML